jgi:hypothetical protein
LIKIIDSFCQIASRKTWPKFIDKIKLGVGNLPQKEIADSQIARGTNE